MNDPLDPSAEYQARLDQIRAGARELSDMLTQVVQELVGNGWTEAQARELVVALMRQSGQSGQSGQTEQS